MFSRKGPKGAERGRKRPKEVGWESGSLTDKSEDEPMLCLHCQAEINHCPYCGLPIQYSGSAVSPLAKLVICDSTVGRHRSFLLSEDNNLVGRCDPNKGRFPEIDLSDFDQQARVSRCHARIYREGNSYLLEDLESCNGTYVIECGMATKINPKEPYLLKHRNRVRFGNIEGILEIIE
jgi:serine/threonine-protein kinase